MSAAARLGASAYGSVLVWLLTAVAQDGRPTSIATAVGAALVLGIVVALRAARRGTAPTHAPALVAIHSHDRVRRGSVVRLADPDAPGRPRPRAPGHPFAG
jgi:hypothetical protein